MPPHRPDWVPVEDVRLRRLFNEGLSDEEIGKLMCRASQGIKRRRQILNLRRGPSPQERATA
jgi:hypothetical protein